MKKTKWFLCQYDKYKAVFVVVVAVFMIGVLMGSKYPIPYVGEDVHEFSATANSKAHKLLVEILESNGLKPWRTFKAGETVQTIMGDKKRLVVAHFTKSMSVSPKDVFTIGVDDPFTSAKNACDRINKSDEFSAEIYQPFPDLQLYLIITDLFFNDSKAFGFRLPSVSIFGEHMPTPDWISNPSEW